jgi:putative NADPH-quinone reductase
MGCRILLINGHPDPRPERFCAALCDAYAAGAISQGREVRRLAVGELDLPLIRTRESFESPSPPPAAAGVQASITWADHVVIVHPLWLGSAPALLKGFCEQVFRYGFALPSGGRPNLRGQLSGRSARLIVTMGMPAPIYRAVFGAFGVRGFERGVLWLAGIRPIRRTLIGQVEADPARRAQWLASVRRLGERGR